MTERLRDLVLPCALALGALATRAARAGSRAWVAAALALAPGLAPFLAGGCAPAPRAGAAEEPTAAAAKRPALASQSAAPVAQAGDPQHDPARPSLPSPEEIAALPPDGGPRWNRLVFEKSPYLLQHAANPIDWFPWGEEAFARADEQDKPIFLSIGYSTCHWCHVMEKESFEDAEVAALLNEHFVSIKVDREERPDVDSLYMSVTQAMTGRGGWPMTVVMMPDRRPFFAGTYFPKHGRFGRQGVMDLLPALRAAWDQDRGNVLAAAESVTSFLVARSSPGESAEPAGREEIEAGFTALARSFDALHGGFGAAPKFPVPHKLRFLLRYWRSTGDERALEMTVQTLEAMARGGIWDHVGFGFHRYSTDARWLLPHFEKMLYDQALLVMAAVEAWQATGEEGLRRTAVRTLEYVLRDMTSPAGGFYSAEDADSEGEEGLFYLWTPEELGSVLGEEDGELAMRVFGVEPEGNFIDEVRRSKTGRNILHLGAPLAELARGLSMELADLEERLESIRGRLFAARKGRVHPLRDDKVLADWNGLMIAAMAKAARAFSEPRYEAAARNAADFVLRELRGEDGRLHKRWREGEAALPPVLDDYAFVVLGLLELYETGFDVRYLRSARELAELMVSDYWGGEHAGFYLSRPDRGDLLVRPRDFHDGAIPSGNAVAALGLLRLARMTGETRWEELAEKALAAASPWIRHAPEAHTQHLMALQFALGPTFEIVVAGDLDAADTRALLRALHEPFLPDKVLVHRPPGDETSIEALAPYTGALRTIGGAATAYVCQDFLCKAPTTDPAAMLSSLGIPPDDDE